MVKLGRAYIRNSGKRIGTEVLTQELVKVRVGSEWVDGVKYVEGSVWRYVRTIEDFNKNFDALG